jgi:hypothetical protein
MVELLINGLYLWFQATPTAPVSRSPQYESFVVHQSSIWLGQLVFGRWPTLWATHQSSYLHRQNIRPTSTNHGTDWTTGRRIVTLIWTHCHKAWLDRNQASCPTTSGLSETKRSQFICNCWFYPSIEEALLSRPRHNPPQELANEARILRHVAYCQKKHNTGQQNITDYFTPIT